MTDTQATPIFDLKSTFDATLAIGDASLPVHIKRFSRTEMEAFEKKWDQFVMEPRGNDVVEHVKRTLMAHSKDAFIGISAFQLEALVARAEHGPFTGTTDDALKETLKFFEDTLREALTLDEGLIRDDGKWVIDGVGFIGVFHARKDVLITAMTEVFKQNRLSGVVRKNSNSPRATDTGSAPSSQARSEEKSASTVPSAGASATAKTSGAALSDATVEDAPKSSGTSDDPTKVH